MKEIRREVAKLLNFASYNVIDLDLCEKNKIYWSDNRFVGYNFGKVRIDNGHFRSGERHIVRGELTIYEDEKKLGVSSYGICISSRWTYEDLIEDIEYSKAPLLKGGEEVVVVLRNSDKKVVYDVFKLRLKNNIDSNCISIVRFEDLEDKILIKMFN